MAKKILTADQKAKKAAYDKAYRERKKAKMIAARTAEAEVVEKPKTKTIPVAKKPAPVVKKPVEAKAAKEPKKEVASITRKFETPVRLFWNRRFEDKNSSCAKPGVELTFEEIETTGENTVYRVRRGKRNFFANTETLAKDGITF